MNESYIINGKKYVLEETKNPDPNKPREFYIGCHGRDTVWSAFETPEGYAKFDNQTPAIRAREIIPDEVVVTREKLKIEALRAGMSESTFKNFAYMLGFGDK